MGTETKSIPVNTLPAGIREGIIISKNAFDGSPDSMEVERPHRDNGYVFILQEKGITKIEIDFEQYSVQESSIVYINPDQVHRLIGFEKAVIISWIITAENLHPEYVKILEDIKTENVMVLSKEKMAILKETANLCIRLYERTDEKLYESILKESTNSLIALTASQFLSQNKTTSKNSRFDTITGLFKSVLEKDFKKIKSPAKYAEILNISTPYLNECVKTSTGASVSTHIHQRIILEAKRLLYHSNKSSKEIAAELGYDDYSYFTRLFSKVTGMTPLAFKNKSLE